MKLTLVLHNKFQVERLEKVMADLSEKRRGDLMFILEGAERNLQSKSRHICDLAEAKRKEQLIHNVIKQKLGDVLFENDCQEPY